MLFDPKDDEKDEGRYALGLRRLPASGVLVRGRGASIGVSSAFHARGLESGSLPHASHMTWYGESRGLDFVQQQFGFESVHFNYLQEIKKCPWHVVTLDLQLNILRA